MDPVSIVFYGIICGSIAALAPSLGRRNARFALGAAIGIVAAILLPAIRAALAI